MAGQLDWVSLPRIEGFASTCVTTTGFTGQDRVDVRTVALAVGCAFSGDLVRQRTTHLVAAVPAAALGQKGVKAREWGIPVLALDWLLDSACQLERMPLEHYLLDQAAAEALPPTSARQQQPPQRDQQRPRLAQPGAAAQHPSPRRLSSVGSNPALLAGQQAPLAADPPQLESADRSPQEPASSRPALVCLDGNLADVAERLRSMSISPEPATLINPTTSSMSEGSWPSRHSSQQSLSLQGMVGAAGGQPQGGVDQEGSSLAGQARLKVWRATALAASPFCPPSAHAGNRSSMPISPQPPSWCCCCAGTPGPGPMAADIPASAMRPEGASFAFSLTAAAAVSPMVESPVCEQAAAQLAVGAGSGPSPLASPLAPTLLRGWMDEEGSSMLLEQSPEALTQMPQVIRDALLLTVELPGDEPAASEAGRQAGADQPGSRVRQSQPALRTQQQQRQQVLETERRQSAAVLMPQRTPAGLTDWSDDDTEAEGPSPLHAAAALLPQRTPAGLRDWSDDDTEAEGPSLQHAVADSEEGRQQLQSDGEPHSEQQSPTAGPSSPFQGLSDLDDHLPAAPASSSGLSDLDRHSSSPRAPQVGGHAASSNVQLPRHSAGGPSISGAQAAQPHATVQGRRRLLQQTAVQDWSEDDSDGGVPRPNGGCCHSFSLFHASHAFLDSSHGVVVCPTIRCAGRRRGMTGLTQMDPALIKVARPRAPALPAAAMDGSEPVAALKFLQRPPRGNAVREHHNLPHLKQVQFAEQVHVAALGLTTSTKDKKTAARLRDPSSASCSDSDPLLAEPCTFYRLPDATWFFEFCRYYTAAQAEALAAAAGMALLLPPGFDRSCELVRSVARQHAAMSEIEGSLVVKKVKTAPGSSMLRLRGTMARSFYWRFALDPTTMRLLTDQPASDFIGE